MLAPQNAHGYDSAIPRRGCPGYATSVRLENEGAGDPRREGTGATLKRGRRESRVPAAPVASCASVENTRVSHHRFTGTPGLPCAMVLTVYSVLFPATNSSCHRHWRIGHVEPGRARNTSANLTPATGARTTRLCRPQQSPVVRALLDRSQA
jgi:hypothetical protein